MEIAVLPTETRTHTTFTLLSKNSTRNDKYYSSFRCLICDPNGSTCDQLIPADPVWCDSVFNYSGERRKLQLHQTKQSHNDQCWRLRRRKNLTYNFRRTCITSDRSAQLALCMQLQPCTRAHTYTRTLTRNQAESLHISSHSHHSAEKKLVSQALLFLQRPVATLKVSAASKPPGCLLASLSPLTHSLTHSLSYLLPHFPSPSLFSLFFHSLFLLPCSLICLFSPCPVSAQCTSIIQRQSTGLSGLSNQSWALH